MNDNSIAAAPLVVIGKSAPTPGLAKPLDLTDDQRAFLADAAGSASVRFVDNLAAADSDIERAEIVVGSLPRDAFARADRLRWLHSWKAGPNDVLYPEMIASEVVLTSSAGDGAIPLAEHAMMLMIMLSHNMTVFMRNQYEGRWERLRHDELVGSTCGIIGVGNAGRELARRAKAFDMRVLGLRRNPEPVENVDELYTRDRFEEFLAESDFVVITAPRTPGTIGMLDEAAFRAMKPTAHVICISRGGIIDDAALLRALDEGWIAGAGLDAHSVEPLPPDSPFWTAPNTIITPHAGATTTATNQRRVDLLGENLQRYFRGEPLLNVVDKQAGY